MIQKLTLSIATSAIYICSAGEAQERLLADPVQYKCGECNAFYLTESECATAAKNAGKRQSKLVSTEWKPKGCFERNGRIIFNSHSRARFNYYSKPKPEKPSEYFKFLPFGCPEPDNSCPAEFPYSFRPKHNFNACCKTTGVDLSIAGTEELDGQNGLLFRNRRAATCKDDQSIDCPVGSGCVDNVKVYETMKYKVVAYDDDDYSSYKMGDLYVKTFEKEPIEEVWEINAVNEPFEVKPVFLPAYSKNYYADGFYTRGDKILDYHSNNKEYKIWRMNKLGTFVPIDGWRLESLD